MFVAGHPNVKLFISHGGLLGTQEAVACGVPMLVIPLYADQALNGRAMSDRGVARIMQLTNIDKHSWRESVSDILNDPRYQTIIIYFLDLVNDHYIVYAKIK